MREIGLPPELTSRSARVYRLQCPASNAGDGGDFLTPIISFANERGNRVDRSTAFVQVHYEFRTREGSSAVRRTFLCSRRRIAYENPSTIGSVLLACSVIFGGCFFKAWRPAPGTQSKGAHDRIP